jgi:hypothetical protein
VCDKIVSAYTQHAHAIIFEKYLKTELKMKISTIKNRNFEKPFRNLSSRSYVNFLEKIFLNISKKMVLRILSRRENVQTSKFRAKIEGKEATF